MAAIAPRPSLNEEALAKRDAVRKLQDNFYRGLVRIAAGSVFLIIAFIIGTIVVRGAPSITWEFLSSPPTEGMTGGGIWPMIRGSILLMLGTLIIVPFIGILAGVWLAEYAGSGRFYGIARALVTTLAGTPSVIFGLFGLAIFVLKFGLGFSLLAGWLTLALMSIPVVVLTTEQAIKNVPESFAEAGVALGFSKWQTIRRILLPNALPGILTGLVLAAGRAAGEAPPILLTAGLYYSTERLILTADTIRKPVANLPYHLAEGYRQGTVIPPNIIWGTCLTLMGFVLLINIGMILLRARARAKQKW